MVTVGMNYHVLPGKQADFEEKFATVINALRAADGHSSSTLWKDVSDDASYLITSEWSDEKAFLEFIHSQAVKRRNAGTAILLVSAELDEVLELSDRVGVMYRGELVAVVDARTADREDVGLLMATGGKAPTEVTKDMAADLEEVS